ncbi:MAG TPA: hypothetical protein PLW99_01255 [Candidatus Paceibacterota bacterium]|nr:MAG: hypothetical protein B7X03_02515 [Parcubacteria group bacterium 21-58-10]OYV83189.1 MAG: hypothetical protein B7W96_00425 [Parcubacteria group bacterium 37-58-5]HQT82760.1 hypothetical protein [Candidatus Paceibacterota bacterium]
MERFRAGGESNPGQHELTEGRGDWCYEKVDGRWQQVLLPRLTPLDIRNAPERERRDANFLEMMRDTRTQWNLDDSTVKHNEGVLRDHPRYRELFEKWAMRYLKMKSNGPLEFSGKIDEDEGRLFGADGRLTKKWLVNIVANGREWIDENIEMELRTTEGFVNISGDEERMQELGIEPEYDGWWTHDEI